MPQPIPRNVAKSWSMNATWVRDHRPECITAVGLVALAWTRLESELTSMISGVLGRTGRYEDGGWAVNPNWIIAAVMGETETIRARIKVVGAIFDRILAGHTLLAEWEVLSARLYKRARDRNIVVHSEWGWSESCPEVLLRIKKDGAIEGWSEDDFLDSFERIHALEIELHLFMKQVLTEIHDRRITTHITPDMIME